MPISTYVLADTHARTWTKLAMFMVALVDSDFWQRFFGVFEFARRRETQFFAIQKSTLNSYVHLCVRINTPT